MSYSTDENWLILSSLEQSIKAKIEAVGTPLSQWGLNINRGLLTGLNDAFIISAEKREELIKEDPRSAEIIRPILRGRDIKRYEYTYANLYIIALFPSKHYDIDDYPAVKKYFLSEFGIERLEQTGQTHLFNGVTVKARKKTSNKWFETQDSISYWDDFSKQKIVYREISDAMNACLVEPDIYLNNKCYLITGDHLIYLLSVFNSVLFTKVIMKEANITGGKGVEFLSKIKIPRPSSNIEKQFSVLYLKRQAGEDVDALVDDLVYHIFNITDLERSSIEKM